MLIDFDNYSIIKSANKRVVHADFWLKTDE